MPRSQTIVGGDGKSLSIAAASIVAKVTRDRLMHALAPRYPGYGWETNVGYRTTRIATPYCPLASTRHHRKLLCVSFQRTSLIELIPSSCAD